MKSSHESGSFLCVKNMSLRTGLQTGVTNSGISGRVLLRYPKFPARDLLAKFRPLPLAHLASSATGSAQFAPPERTRYIFCCAEKYGVAAVETGGKQLSTGQLH